MSNSQDNRPLSPHLQVYSWQITMTMSILHRATGVALSVGAVALVAWLVAAASGAEAFDAFNQGMNSVVGGILACGWVFCLYYHMLNGIRHLFWDAGKGFSMEALYRGGYAVIAVSTVLTAITWYCLLVGGAA
jgi:succinate dehydrogenase / fumarate reductase cytochrome b subunit